ncbi:MAG: hypothetical protein ACRDTG_31310 [Pseudonocardiaceae bacterium]
MPLLPGVAHFADIAEPHERLKSPPDYDTAYPHEPQWYDIVSPGALLRDAIWTVTGAAASLGICDRAYDPYEVILKPLIGDWARVRACADVFRNLADAAIMAAASAGVAGLAGSTGVGLPIALIIGAFTLTRIYKVVHGIYTIIDTIARLDALAYATSSAQNSFGQIDSDSTLPALVPPLPS